MHDFGNFAALFPRCFPRCLENNAAHQVKNAVSVLNMNNSPIGKYQTSTKAIWWIVLLITASILFLAVNVIVAFSLPSLIVIGLLIMLAVIAYRFHVNELEKKTGQVKEAGRVHLATVEVLATAIDARDQVGRGHVRRTQIYAVGVGQVLGLAENEINALRAGALLHDIGKLAVPEHILNKPGSLTAAERKKTKIHSEVGASILEKVGFEYPVIPTVKYHHEWFDGTGYPAGLKGESIPMTARILAVADAYDTLRCARPYREPVPKAQARQIILDGAGTQFDPTIVQTLVSNLHLFEAEIKKQGLAYAVTLPREASETSTGDQNYVEQIKLANREVSNLYEFARELSASFSLENTLDLFAKKVGEFVPLNTCALYLLDGPKLYATAVRVEGDNCERLSQRRIRAGQGATGFALKTGETVQNVDPDLDFFYSLTEMTQQYSTMASVPLIADGKLLGAVTVYSSDLRNYGEEHIRLLETISRIAANAIGKALQHDEAKTHALTDPMTGLPNARNLQIQFEKEVARASRSGTSFQLLMLDLDGFKAVNDSFGHKAGDEMLSEIGKVILGQLREYDFLARYGGDEFVILIPETNAGEVVDLCVRIERAVSEFSLNVDNEKCASVGVSLGSSSFPANGGTIEEMIAAADKAMYDRKTSRKQTVSSLDTDENIIDEPIGMPGGFGEWVLLNNDVPFDPYINDGFIIELDESHVLSTLAIN